MRHEVARTAVAAGAVACALAIASPAGAHEARGVEDIEMLVGWGDEPTYTGFKNSVELVLTDQRGEPITKAGDNLQVEVVYGDASTTLDMEPNFVVGAFGEPGDYRAWLTPTRAGDYTFRFTGTIAGTKIDETFRSGPDTFSPVEDVKAIQFPAQDPSGGELAQRIERETARLEGDLGAARAAQEDADSARTLAVASIGVALVALLGTVVVGMRAGRSRA